MRNTELQKKIDVWIEENLDQMIEDAIELTKIRSVSERGEGGYPYGIGCARVLDLALSFAQRMGFETDNQDYYSGTALMKGETERQLGIFGHLDIVPEGDLANWDFPPYEAKLQDGYVIGRGSSDNKCPAVVSLYTMKCIHDLGLPMKHSVLMYFGCEEEAGMSDIEHYLERYPAPEFSFTSDGRYSLCNGEKGILTADLTTDVSDCCIVDFDGGQASNMVPDYAKVVLCGNKTEKLLSGLSNEFSVTEQTDGTVIVEVNGIAGHAAFPEGSVSAIQKLAAALLEHAVLDKKAESVIRFLAEGFADYYGTGLHIDSEDAVFGKTTAVGGRVFVKEGRLHQLLNVRYAAEVNQEEMIESLCQTCSAYGYNAEQIKNDPPMYISIDDPCVKLLHETANEFLDGTYAPYVMGGGTYARKIPRAVAYGPTTRKIDATDELKYGEGHQPNEGMKVSDMTTGIRIYVNALLRLDKLLK